MIKTNIMSSLVTSASAWSNDTPKKRASTMRKTIKKRSSDDDNDTEGDKLVPRTIEDMQNISNQRSERVNDLLNQMASVGTDDENSNMGNFQPIEPPAVQTRKDMQSVEYSNEYTPSVSTYLEASTAHKYKKQNKDVEYGANGTSSEKLSNYNKSYEAPTNKPYYANMGITTSNSRTPPGGNDKLMERINYMIHLLEAQQHEKTDNITEEFILYTFLGVFVIFVVDSFARTGTYKR